MLAFVLHFLYHFLTNSLVVLIYRIVGSKSNDHRAEQVFQKRQAVPDPASPKNL